MAHDGLNYRVCPNTVAQAADSGVRVYAITPLGIGGAVDVDHGTGDCDLILCTFERTAL